MIADFVSDLQLCYFAINRVFFFCYVFVPVPKIFEKTHKKVQVGKDQEKAQSEKKTPTPKTKVGKKTN